MAPDLRLPPVSRNGGTIMVSQRTPIGCAVAAGNVADGGAQTRGVNVGRAERVLSLAGGGLLAWLGVKQGGLLGTAIALIGGGIAYRGVSGHCPGYAALGITPTSSTARKPASLRDAASRWCRPSPSIGRRRLCST